MASQCAPSQTHCEFYLCLEKEMNCGYRGFPLRYGYRFCERFKTDPEISENLSQWLKTTRFCLQDKIAKGESYTCKNMNKKSVKDHMNCYLDTGYCDLNKKEKNFVKKKIIAEFLSAPGYITQNAIEFLKKGCR